MDAREYLEGIRNMDNEITAKVLVVEEMEAMVNRATPMFTNMPGAPSPDPKSGEKLKVELIDKKRELNELIDKFIDYKAEAMRYIDKLELPKHRIVLIERYIHLSSWNVIPMVLGCKDRQAYKFHADALKEFEKIINNC